MIILVFGGRDYDNAAHVKEVLDRYKIDCIIHGAAPGADTLAEKYAKINQINYRGYPAKWKIFDKSAGYKRNVEMIEDSKNMGSNIDLAIGFPGGKGTKMMKELAERASIKVLEA